MSPTMTDWYFLRDSRKSFKLNPLRDRDMFFCHQAVEQSIRDAVEQAYGLGTPIKLMLWGDWGVGKTHTLRHLEYWLTQHESEYPTYTAYVEIGDLDPKSSFAAIHKDLLEGIGQHLVTQWVHSYVSKYGSLITGLQSIGVPSYVRDLFNRFLMTAPGAAPTEIVMSAWQCLKGDENGAKQSALGVGAPITEGKDFYQVLAALGHLCERVTERKLLFMVDEAAKLDEAGLNATMERHWVNVNKLIFDQDNTFFGFIYTVSGKNRKALPKAIFEPQIQNRLGENRLLALPTLEPQDVRGFLGSLFARLVDRAEMLADAGVCSEPGFNADTYPLAETAFEEFVGFFQRSQQDSKPRDITDRLDTAAFDAFRRRARLIDEQALQKAGL